VIRNNKIYHTDHPSINQSMEKIVLVLVVSLALARAATWTYTKGIAGPANWTAVNSQCGGKEQSPIDIVYDKTEHSSDLGTIKVSDNWEVPVNSINYTLENDGHSVKVKLRQNDDYTRSPIFTNRAGYGCWRLVQFHLHWSGSATEGSEHTLDGTAYPAELHLIHINPKYNVLGDAIKNKDGLMVFGFFVEIDDAKAENAEFTTLFNEFTKVEYSGQEHNISPFTIKNLIQSANLDKYYTYKGSLTTPGCDETVTWIVFNETIHFSSAQMTKLRALQSHDATYYNNTRPKDNPVLGRFRPVQNLNGRTVYRSFDGSAGVMVKSSLLFIVSLVSLTLMKLY